MDYVEGQFDDKMVYHSLINAIHIQEGLKIPINIPHELYFIESFLNMIVSIKIKIY